jgi:hypothetical protein
VSDSKLKGAGKKLFDSFYNTASGKNAVDTAALNALIAKQGVNASTLNTPEAIAAYMQKNASELEGIANTIKSNPFSTKVPLEEGSKVVVNPLKTTASGMWDALKAHKGAAIGTGLLGAGNIAGLVDNDKILGQALGAVGGGLIGAAIPGFGPLGIANMAMGAGNLGALFDVLRSKKEQEKQYQQQYY